MIAPITPDELGNRLRYTSEITKEFPEVIQSFNDTIRRHWDGCQAVFPQEEVSVLIVEQLGVTKDEIVRWGLMDIEQIYQEAGWSVKYTGLAYNYNEMYSAYFIFSRQG